MTRFPVRTALVLALLTALIPVAPRAESAGDIDARLAVEEAEVRDRIVTALAIAQGLRLRGRTIMIAIQEIERAKRSLRDISPTDPDREKLEARLALLIERRKRVDQELDAEFDAYLELIGELSSTLWPRLRRVGENLVSELEERDLGRLANLLPIVRAHAEYLNRQGSLGLETMEQWRNEIDDSRQMRENRMKRERRNPDLSADEELQGDRDI